MKDEHPGEGPDSIRAEIEKLRAQEASALTEAVWLKGTSAPRERVVAALRKCQETRVRKNELVQKLITALEGEHPEA